jgi:hypothetical protein
MKWLMQLSDGALRSTSYARHRHQQSPYRFVLDTRGLDWIEMAHWLHCPEQV